MNESDFTVTYRENCSYNTIKVEQNTGFQRFFTSDEFTSQNRIEAELGWMNGTTKQCLIDLSQSQTTIDLSFAVRSKTILPVRCARLFPVRVLRLVHGVNKRKGFTTDGHR
ncbi:MAG: hypothetical protein H7A23_20935 [Leptospiraceae bacterium]|nr:hypothetical protein [Leptospiraceae bacterium]